MSFHFYIDTSDVLCCFFNVQVSANEKSDETDYIFFILFRKNVFNFAVSFNIAQLDSIKRVKLAKLFCENFGLDEIQRRVFTVVSDK